MLCHLVAGSLCGYVDVLGKEVAWLISFVAGSLFEIELPSSVRIENFMRIRNGFVTSDSNAYRKKNGSCCPHSRLSPFGEKVTSLLPRTLLLSARILFLTGHTSGLTGFLLSAGIPLLKQAIKVYLRWMSFATDKDPWTALPMVRPQFLDY